MWYDPKMTAFVVSSPPQHLLSSRLEIRRQLLMNAAGMSSTDSLIHIFTHLRVFYGVQGRACDGRPHWGSPLGGYSTALAAFSRRAPKSSSSRPVTSSAPSFIASSTCLAVASGLTIESLTSEAAPLTCGVAIDVAGM